MPPSSHPAEPSHPAETSASPESIYTTLTTHLHTHRLSTLSLEILPPTSPTPLQHDALHLGITRHALTQTFLTARTIFLSQPSSSSSPAPPPSPALEPATKILLLHDPEHLSAANWRKRRICHLHEQCTAAGDDTTGAEQLLLLLRRAVREEWAFVTSLLTSPLHRHAKSPTLWWQRCWLARHHIAHLLPQAPPQDGPSPARAHTTPLTTFLRAEIDVILQAAEQHRANYHAFHYGRRVLRQCAGARGTEEGAGVVEKVRRWCFAHPRDGSGWGFLAFLVRREGLVRGGGEREEEEEEGEAVVDRVRRQTREFVAALGWKGESVEWFLREVDGAKKWTDDIRTESVTGGIG
ncbi:hypothetical protein MMC26_002892 [Xylographa opegraphella]|nr:hypothetical protein [Xylographa opegraphella]